jgi:alkylation response protein AidB-like acyl-CoA dehydrogenase
VANGAGAVVESVDPLRNLTLAPENATDDAVLLDLGALMAAAQLLGLAEAMLDQAVTYAKVREQFGQPVGAFQAVKHKLADVAVALEFVRPVVWRAAQALDDHLTSAPVHVSHAKYAATDTAYLAAESAIQVHGAMGYTYEVDLHFWMKRSWALAGAWGDRSFHFNRVSAAVRTSALLIGPSYTFA